MSDRVMSPALFKATLDSAALKLAQDKPTGFTVADVAAEIGCSEITVEMRKSIRQRLKTLCKHGNLFSPNRGLYLASGTTSAAVQIACDPILLDDLRRAFFEAGGFMLMPDILTALGFDDPGAEKRVRTVMCASPLFDRFTPLKGMRRHWRLSDSERVTVPVPGRWMMVDLQLTAFRAGGGRIPWAWGLNGDLEAYRVRVGNALRDARKLWRLSPESIVEDSVISGALDACFSRATDLPYLDPGIPEVSDYKVAEWWEDCKAGMGMADALAEAWRMLEGDGGHPYLLDALDTASWVAIGARTKLDPAWLSRGAVALNFVVQ
jgi:hypothetical protein